MADSRAVRSSLEPFIDPRYDGNVTQYRGIRYATIQRRFARPRLNTEWQKTTDCTKFGARCPQTSSDIRDFFLMPKSIPNWPADREDELECDNLTISCPSDTSSQKLPVILWIYGGSQAQTYGSASQQVGDINPFVAQSIELGKPVVFVSIHYRLNIFAFGGNEGELNLDLQDQRLAVEWVKKYISHFGGDPDRITLAGESAGAIYIHALLASGTEVSRAILHSGSLFASPPQADKKGIGLVSLIEGNLALIEMENGNMNPSESVAASLAGAPTERLVQTLKDLHITRKWLWQEKALDSYQQLDKVFGRLKGLMVGDCESEGIIYMRAINKMKGAGLLKVFESVGEGKGKTIADAYGISASEDAASRKGTLNFMGDAKFNWPSSDLTQKLRKEGIKVHRFIYDQVNPFLERGSVAYHGCDLLAIFGGYDDIVNDEMKAVGKQLRENWISFVNDEEPWSMNKVFAYGPAGKSGEIDDAEVTSRRREKQFEVLDEVGFDITTQLWQALLAAGESTLQAAGT